MTSQPNRLTHEAVHNPYARSAVAARLELAVEREAGKVVDRIVVFDGELLRLGSHESNELVVVDPTVSRFHCRLVHDRTAWKITDQSSLNGTRMGGLRIRDVDLPEGGCKLQLGDSVVRIRELPAEHQVELLARPSFGDLIGNTLPMHRLFAILDKVAQSGSNVLIEGEPGTGKELVATELVRRGPRARKPFVLVDCSTISPHLIESELFGHVKGAFVGAERDRTGAFEAAQGGTVFLDEIGELPLDIQAKLLRALESREVRRLGDSKTRKIDVRVVAATNRKLEREVNNGRFREDLYFRLSVVTVRVPPLRERLEDIELLVNGFLESMQSAHTKHLFRGETLASMMRHDWPGNVRELRHFVERTLAFQDTSGTAPGDVRGYSSEAYESDGESKAALSANAVLGTPPRGIGAQEQPRPTPPEGERRLANPDEVLGAQRAVSGKLEAASVKLVDAQFKSAKERVVAEFERGYVSQLLDWSEGNISRAARKAGMDRMNLYRLIQRYGLRDPRSLRD